MDSFQELIKTISEYGRSQIKEILIGGSIVTLILTWIEEHYWGLLKKTWIWFVGIYKQLRSDIPRKTLSIVIPTQLIPQHCWQMSKLVKSGEKGMLVSCKCYISNISPNNKDVAITRVRIKYAKEDGQLMGLHDTEEAAYSKAYVKTIPYDMTMEAQLDFWISPRIRKEGQKLKTKLYVYDQYNNCHEKTLELECLPRKPKSSKKNNMEESS
ncbi:MAG: hypothetical protein ABIH66_02720 [bacterium]